jgi:D-alanyl-D-alanine carboxypeptidase
MRAGRPVLLVTAGLATAAVVAVVVTRGSGSPSPERRLASRLDDVVAAGAPGALGLAQNRWRTIRGASGLADRATRRPVRPTDRFRIGSITKTFVAAVVLQLVAEGTLKLDAPVERWLPDLVPRGITVRQLLDHTSGLYDYVNDPRTFRTGATSPRRLVDLALSHAPNGRPGERYGYASTNYVVLGLLVERATGTSLSEQLARRIFRPLRLGRTSFDPGAAAPEVHGYQAPTRDGIEVAEPEDTRGKSAAWAWAAGAIVSDTRDVARFFAALLGGRLVPRTLLEHMVPDRGYGLGLLAYRTRCGPAVGHSGHVLGYVSVAWSAPDGSRQAVALANRYPLGPDGERALRRALEAAYCDVPHR